MKNMTLLQIKQARKLLERGESDKSISRLIRLPLLAVHCLRCYCEGLEDDAALERCEVAATLPNADAVDVEYGVTEPPHSKTQSKKSFFRRLFDGDGIF